MPKQVLLTGDGSHTISIQEKNTTYHSKHGAIQESQHIFIEAGLKPLLHTQQEIAVFEVGFGTGLNALLTIRAIEQSSVKIYYETVETDPVELSLISALNYTEILKRPDLDRSFMQLHEGSWNSPYPVTEQFYIYKRNADISNIVLTSTFDIVYFDAFGPEVQPELWTPAVFKKLYNAMREGGILLTYCSKSAVRHIMQDAGFAVEKIPGPWGKREIVRAKAMG